MAYYLTYGEFQRNMKAYYERTGSRMQFPEMSEYLYRKGLLQQNISFPELSDDYDNMSDEEFDQVVDSLPLCLTPYIGAKYSSNVRESDMIPNTKDVFVIRHPRYTRPQLHKHNYFEINFVFKGQGKFIFEKEMRIMRQGELCIIAPSSNHDFLIEDESTVFTICIRQSTFDTTFFSLMSRKDLLSYFFRTILKGNEHSNYLLFFTKEHGLLKRYIRNMMIESSRRDMYGNSCCISYVNLFFSTVLRNYSQTIQFYNYQLGTDFSLVLQYIQHNYQTLTLSALANLFHYSEPHLCTLIKQNTGFTFTELIKRLRLADATDFLVNTNLKVGEIAEQIGYNSADHFSRVFRSTYKMSPLEYRKLHQDSEDSFVPFAFK
ncbi:MAG: AraC family transcriptional regulator [Eubacteriales bacterium]|nr:AraC family transcriptional regulator [Eubacteriales bacterium]